MAMFTFQLGLAQLPRILFCLCVCGSHPSGYRPSLMLRQHTRPSNQRGQGPKPIGTAIVRSQPKPISLRLSSALGRPLEWLRLSGKTRCVPAHDRPGDSDRRQTTERAKRDSHPVDDDTRVPTRGKAIGTATVGTRSTPGVHHPTLQQNMMRPCPHIPGDSDRQTTERAARGTPTLWTMTRAAQQRSKPKPIGTATDVGRGIVDQDIAIDRPPDQECRARGTPTGRD